MPYLTNDGTLDTVIRCECGREHRYNYANEDVNDVAGPDGEITVDYDYDQFVEDCIADVTDSCECHETKE